MHAHQALNCVVDDSALVAGVKDNSTNNIKKWINEGLINVFVPLYGESSETLYFMTAKLRI